MTTANKITVTRILIIPVFVMMAIYYGRGVQRRDPQPWQQYSAIIVFLLAAASDGLDGYVARRYNQRSQLGVILDPIADKGLLLAGIITLSFSNWTYEFPPGSPSSSSPAMPSSSSAPSPPLPRSATVQVKPSWIGKTATAAADGRHLHGPPPIEPVPSHV